MIMECASHACAFFRSEAGESGSMAAALQKPMCTDGEIQVHMTIVMNHSNLRDKRTISAGRRVELGAEEDVDDGKE